MLADTIVPTTNATGRRGSIILANVFRRIVFRALDRLAAGRIEIVENEVRTSFGVTVPDCDLQACVHVQDERFYRVVVLGGSLGAGEAYMKGWWTTSNLTSLLRIFILNEQAFSELEGPLTKVSSFFHRMWHSLRWNSRHGSRRNISAHYDLSNEFYRLFLDESLTYSCAIFENPDATLCEASIAKLDRICRKLELSAKDHVLEIGTGWGSFALHAAKQYGCRVTTTTISSQQYDLAKKRIEDASLTDRITILHDDYRDLQGQFDKVVSIEMIEAIGWRQYDLFFRKISELLNPQGMACIQAITMADRHYEQAKRGVDFIKRYIFPGSNIPSIGAMATSISRTGDLTISDLEDITPHYPPTLRAWYDRFNSQLSRVREIGFSEDFIRMWEFYLCYCEAGFTERYIGDVQLLLVKPGYRCEHGLPISNR